MSGPTVGLGPAELLEGHVLNGRWKVLEARHRNPGGTGQSRSSCYLGECSKSHERVFIKAFDFRHREIQGNIKELSWMLDEFINEAEVLEYCNGKKLSRATRFIEKGVVTVSGEPVHYIVCEHAEWTIRDAFPPGEETIPLHTKLIVIRDLISAVRQLNGAGIAHQDVKPSNAVIVKGERDTLKMTDFGSASCSERKAPPHDALNCVGELTYAPYERLYGAAGTWYQRRIGCDMFLVGCFAFTMVVGVPVTPVVLHGIPAELRPDVFTGSSYSEVLPDLIEHHFKLIPEFTKAILPESICEPFTKAVLELCHPDPAKRGTPRTTFCESTQYSLERYVSLFNRLAVQTRLNQRS